MQNSLGFSVILKKKWDPEAAEGQHAFYAHSGLVALRVYMHVLSLSRNRAGT